MLADFVILIFVSQDRSPQLSFIDVCSIFEAVAVRDGPGPNLGQKPAQNRPKQKSIFLFPNLRPSHISFEMLSAARHRGSGHDRALSPAAGGRWIDAALDLPAWRPGRGPFKKGR